MKLEDRNVKEALATAKFKAFDDGHVDDAKIMTAIGSIKPKIAALLGGLALGAAVVFPVVPIALYVVAAVVLLVGAAITAYLLFLLIRFVIDCLRSLYNTLKDEIFNFFKFLP